MMGDTAFWNGLRLYTGDQWGQAATSEDLKKALDAENAGNRSTDKKGGAPGRRNRKNGATSSPTNLDNLFDLWVYGIPSTTSR
jgi:hypothetical protein